MAISDRSRFFCFVFVFAFFVFFGLIWPSTNPEKEEVNSHSCFLLRTKKSANLVPRAPFPSLLGSSECIVSRYKGLGGGMLLRAYLSGPCLFYMKCALGSASALLTGVLRVDAACWTTQGSCRGCPSSHVLHSSRMFLTLSNRISLPGLGLSDWNVTKKESPRVIQILTSPQPLLVFLIPLIFSDDKLSPELLPTPQHLLVLISATSQETGMQIRIFC